MKNIKRFVLAALVALLSNLSAYAQVYAEIDGVGYNIYEDADTAIVTSLANSKYSGDVKIPASVAYEGKTFKVSAIASYAFYLCKQLSSIEIPNSIKCIGRAAFYGCNHLTSIKIPISVNSIGYETFYGCI